MQLINDARKLFHWRAETEWKPYKMSILIISDIESAVVSNQWDPMIHSANMFSCQDGASVLHLQL